MLGRATKAYEPSANKKNDLSKQLFPSSSPAQDGNIAEGFKKARQSIGGFVGGTTNISRANPSNALRARSPNINPSIKRTSSSAFGAYSTPNPTATPSIFNKPNAFQDTQNTVDLTQDSHSDYQLPKLSQHVPVFANDFDSDVDLSDDSGDYELPKKTLQPMAAPPKRIQKSPSLTPRPRASQQPSSSAISWSSSPSAHFPPPLVTLARKPAPAQDPNPRPTKRRTLPWVQKKAEEDEIAAREADMAEFSAARKTSVSSPQIAKCFRCNEVGHYAMNCPTHIMKSETVHDLTPLPMDKKNKPMPWNNTGSAIGIGKKLVRDKQKAKSQSAKERMANDDSVAQHNRKKATMVPVTLSDEQRRVLDLVCNQSKSVFFTGSAGTGKSVLMRAIIADLKKKFIRETERVAVTASTGLAACNIGGVTLHSFGGIGLGKEDVPTLVKKIRRNQKAKTRWLKTKILIIDEISMVDGELFDKLEGIARALRNNGRPFGGIQLVITGDFFQLPPVPDYDNKARGVKFAFDANTWSTAIHHTIGLTEVFRQKDPVFANMLNEMRLGKITEETIKAFKKLDRPLEFEHSLTATELFPTRNEVDNSNSFRMRDLKGQLYRYDAVDTGSILDINVRDKLLSNMMAPKTIELKKGAQVMLIKNMDDGLVNGSLGTVSSFMTETTFEIYDRNPDILDERVADEDLDEQNRGIRATFKLSNEKSRPDTGKLYPLVGFKSADGTYREMLVMHEEWKVELPNGEVQAQRSQLPLILAWALSIHKAQGQTLPMVKIDLKKIFEKGQAYVALSRATSQAGLVVLNFDKSKVMAHPRVAQFYNSLYSVNKALEHPKVSKAPTTITSKTPKHVYEIDDEDEQESMRAYG